MADLGRDQIDAKIFLLRQKHKDKRTNRTDMSEGSPYHKDLSEWLKDKEPAPDYGKMAVTLTANYTKRHQPNIEPDTLPVYAPQAILALSIDKPIYIAEADATDVDLRDHQEVRREVKRRHDIAAARWDRFITQTRRRMRSTKETWAQMEEREQREKRDRGSDSPDGPQPFA